MSEERPTLDVHVLVVDDEPMIRDLVGRVLDGECRKVTLAESGAIALDRIADSDVDLVVTDLKMPGVDGIAVLRAAHAKSVAIEVIVISGFVDRDAEAELETLRAHLLKKPFPPRALLALVRELVAAR